MNTAPIVSKVWSFGAILHKAYPIPTEIIQGT